MYKHKFRSKKTFLKFLISNGVHIWVILFLANVVFLYTYNLASRAAPNKSEVKTTQIASDESEPSPTPEPTEIPPTPTPVGPILNVVFTIPPIGSSGANLKPTRTARDVTVSLYSPNLNAFDAKVKPLYSVKTKAYYDDNQLSPTYTSFIVKDADLGDKIKSGKYQITIKTDQTLPQLIKEKPKNIAGSVYNLDNSLPIDPAIPPQSLIVGDIAPIRGNGIMDINDYNTFVSCFQATPNSLCVDKRIADFDDNGTVDGVDYNFLVLSFKQLLALGYPVPSIIISPTPRQVSKLSELDTTKTPKKATAAAVPTKDTSGNPLLLIFSVIFLLLCGGAAAFFLFKNKNLLANFHKKLDNAPPTPTDGTDASVTESAPQETVEGEASPTEEQPTETPAETSEVQPADTATEQPTTEAPAADTSVPAVGDTMEGDYYVKKQADTDDKTGVWVTITGDNGPELALYKGSNLHEGFSHVKGVYQEVNKKVYIELNEIIPADSD